MLRDPKEEGEYILVVVGETGWCHEDRFAYVPYPDRVILNLFFVSSARLGICSSRACISGLHSRVVQVQRYGRGQLWPSFVCVDSSYCLSQRITRTSRWRSGKRSTDF
jgi:hypothetical protein